MYRIVVGELGGRDLAVLRCRISALPSADYCLRDRLDVACGKVAWKGNKKEISRVFEAERLDASGLKHLKSGKDYRVLFQRKCRAECA